MKQRSWFNRDGTATHNLESRLDTEVSDVVSSIAGSTRDVHVLRSPNLLFIKKTTHHRKLKMQSFLNVITL